MGVNIKGRKSRMPFDLSDRRTFRFRIMPSPDGSFNSFDYGGRKGVVWMADNDKSNLTEEERVHRQEQLDKLGVAKDGVGKASAVLGGVASIAEKSMSLAEIADTSEIEGGIDDLANSDYTSAGSNRSLLSQWNSTKWQKSDYTQKDVRGMSGGEMAGQIGGATIDGAMAGLQAGGPWGAVAGAAVGLGSSLGGMFAGNRKARRKAEELNDAAAAANRDATNAFTQANSQLAQQSFNAQMANLSAYGGAVDRWRALPLADRSRLIGLYVRNGVSDLVSMRSHYNAMAHGGNRYDGEGDNGPAPAQHIDPDELLDDVMSGRSRFSNISNDYKIESPWLGDYSPQYAPQGFTATPDIPQILDAPPSYEKDPNYNPWLSPAFTGIPRHGLGEGDAPIWEYMPQKQVDYTSPDAFLFDPDDLAIRLANAKRAEESAKADVSRDIQDEYAAYAERVGRYGFRPADMDMWYRQRGEVLSTGKWYGNRVMNPIDPDTYLLSGASGLLPEAGVTAAAEDRRSAFERYWDGRIADARKTYEETGDRTALDSATLDYTAALNERSYESMMEVPVFGANGILGYFLPGWAELLAGYNATKALKNLYDPAQQDTASRVRNTIDLALWTTGAFSPLLERIGSIAGGFGAASLHGSQECIAFYMNDPEVFRKLPKQYRDAAMRRLETETRRAVENWRRGLESGVYAPSVGERAVLDLGLSDEEIARNIVRNLSGAGDVSYMSRFNWLEALDKHYGNVDVRATRRMYGSVKPGAALTYQTAQMLDNPAGLAEMPTDYISNAVFDATDYAGEIPALETAKSAETAAGGGLEGFSEVFGRKRFNVMEGVLQKRMPEMDDVARAEFYRNLSELKGKHPTETANKQKCAFNWFLNGAVKLPEDSEKINEAFDLATKRGVDAQSYDGPASIIDALRSKRNVRLTYVQPETFPDCFSNRTELQNGIVVYDVADTKEAQAAVRRIIDTHVGPDANPWCLTGKDPKTGELYDKAWDLWNHYGAQQKRIAFKDGRIVGFYANSNESPVWWDLKDNECVCNGIEQIDDPMNIRVFTKKDVPGIGRCNVLESYNGVTGEYNGDLMFTRGEKGQAGTYESYAPDGHLIETSRLVESGEKDDNGKPELLRDGVWRKYVRNYDEAGVKFLPDEGDWFESFHSEYRIVEEDGSKKSICVGVEFTRNNAGVKVEENIFNDAGEPVTFIKRYDSGVIQEMIFKKGERTFREDYGEDGKINNRNMFDAGKRMQYYTFYDGNGAVSSQSIYSYKYGSKIETGSSFKFTGSFDAISVERHEDGVHFRDKDSSGYFILDGPDADGHFRFLRDSHGFTSTDYMMSNDMEMIDEIEARCEFAYKTNNMLRGDMGLMERALESRPGTLEELFDFVEREKNVSGKANDVKKAVLDNVRGVAESGRDAMEVNVLRDNKGKARMISAIKDDGSTLDVVSGTNGRFDIRYVTASGQNVSFRYADNGTVLDYAYTGDGGLMIDRADDGTLMVGKAHQEQYFGTSFYGWVFEMDFDGVPKRAEYHYGRKPYTLFGALEGEEAVLKFNELGYDVLYEELIDESEEFKEAFFDALLRHGPEGLNEDDVGEMMRVIEDAGSGRLIGADEAARDYTDNFVPDRKNAKQYGMLLAKYGGDAEKARRALFTEGVGDSEFERDLRQWRVKNFAELNAETSKTFRKDDVVGYGTAYRMIRERAGSLFDGMVERAIAEATARGDDEAIKALETVMGNKEKHIGEVIKKSHPLYVDFDSTGRLHDIVSPLDEKGNVKGYYNEWSGHDKKAFDVEGYVVSSYAEDEQGARVRVGKFDNMGIKMYKAGRTVREYENNITHELTHALKSMIEELSAEAEMTYKARIDDIDFLFGLRNDGVDPGVKPFGKIRTSSGIDEVESGLAELRLMAERGKMDVKKLPDSFFFTYHIDGDGNVVIDSDYFGRLKDEGIYNGYWETREGHFREGFENATDKKKYIREHIDKLKGLVDSPLAIAGAFAGVGGAAYGAAGREAGN